MNKSFKAATLIAALTVSTAMFSGCSGDGLLQMFNSSNETSQASTQETTAKITEESSEKAVTETAANTDSKQQESTDEPTEKPTDKPTDPPTEPKRNKNIPADAEEYNGHYYYVYSNVCDTWEDAKSYCEALDGHLAIINDSAENKFLYEYVSERGFYNAYFGLTDSESEGVWKWIDGATPDFLNWDSGEPGGGGDENYARFERTYGAEYKWVDDSGEKIENFICEWE